MRKTHAHVIVCAFAILHAAVAYGTPVATFTDPDSGEILELWVMDSAPPDLITYDVQMASPDEMMAATMLSSVPTSSWTYGCSATSAGMMFGYYDHWGGPGGDYVDMYNGTVPSYMGNNHALIATSLHTTDYWISYGSVGPDPWVGNWAEHAWADCTGDFMGTNQWKWDYDTGGIDFNTDGSTTFHYWTNGARSYDYIPAASWGLPQTLGTHGLRLFAESRGYSVVHDGSNYQIYNQYIDTLGKTYGFTYDEYMAEIDADRAVLIHLAGHTMLGYGYNNDTTNQVILYDTWDTSSHTMVWGTSYGGMDHRGVTVMHLNQVPEPGTLALLGFGLVGIALWRKRRKQG